MIALGKRSKVESCDWVFAWIKSPGIRSIEKELGSPPGISDALTDKGSRNKSRYMKFR